MNHRLPPAPSTLAPVLDRDTHKVGVWYCDDGINRSPHQRGPKIDLDHFTF